MANIGFISTRFAGQDGVSLESAKWAEVLWADRGHVSFWYSGRNDRHPDISHCVPEAHFGFPENEWINRRIWGRTSRDPLVTDRIHEMAAYLKRTLYQCMLAQALSLKSNVEARRGMKLKKSAEQKLLEDGRDILNENYQDRSVPQRPWSSTFEWHCGYFINAWLLIFALALSLLGVTLYMAGSVTVDVLKCAHLTSTKL